MPDRKKLLRKPSALPAPTSLEFLENHGPGPGWFIQPPRATFSVKILQSTSIGA
jgi:hypothetical protein